MKMRRPGERAKVAERKARSLKALMLQAQQCLDSRRSDDLSSEAEKLISRKLRAASNKFFPVLAGVIQLCDSYCSGAFVYHENDYVALSP